MNKEIKITAMRIIGDKVTDKGKDLARNLPSHARYRYEQETCYLLENNTCLFTTIRAETKPKLSDRIRRTGEQINNGEMFAYFDAAGNWGTVLKMSLRRAA